MNFGAINKQTNEYILPSIANKEDIYLCPDCNKGLVLCKGIIRKTYFRHKIDKKEPCKYYTSPSESQIHKDAKYRLKNIIENKSIEIHRYCSKCSENTEYSIPIMDETSKIIIEYNFRYNNSNKIADVVYLDNNEIVCIFEICYKHKTKSGNRPEPWFELNADDIVNISETKTKDIKLKCIRDLKCENCIYMEELKTTNLEKYIRIKLGQDFENPKYINWEENSKISKDEYDKLNKNDKKYYRYYHKRFNFDASDAETRENNRNICNIFNNDLHNNKLVIYSAEGTITGYIVSYNNYKRHNYWKHSYPGVNEYCLDLPYKYCKEMSGNGTVNIIKHFIQKSRKFIPSNNCK